MSSATGRRAPLAAPLTATGLFVLASNINSPAALPLPGKLAWESKKFTVRAEGNAQFAAASNLTFTLLGNVGGIPQAPAKPPLVAGSWTTICAAAAAAITTPGGAWWLQAELIFDSTSGNMTGVFSSLVGHTPTPAAIITGFLAGINGSNQPISQAGTMVQPVDPVAWLALQCTISAPPGVVNLVNFEAGF